MLICFVNIIFLFLALIFTTLIALVFINISNRITNVLYKIDEENYKSKKRKKRDSSKEYDLTKNTYNKNGELNED